MPKPIIWWRLSLSRMRSVPVSSEVKFVVLVSWWKVWTYKACNIQLTSDLSVVFSYFGSPPRGFSIPSQTAAQHLTAPAQLSCRKLSSVQFSAVLQQTAKSVAADSKLKLQSVSAVDHTVVYQFSHVKGQVLCLPGTYASSCMFHDHQIVSLVATVSSVATTVSSIATTVSSVID